MIKNKTHVEELIFEVYSARNFYFFSYYFKFNVRIMKNKVSCNYDGGENEEVDQTSTIFNHLSRSCGTSSIRYLNKKKIRSCMYYLIVNKCNH